jgi:hypothetical protein
MISDQRHAQSAGAPKRRYEDAKAASASAADRISAATKNLLAAFRDVYQDEYDRPRDPAARLVSTASDS